MELTRLRRERLGFVFQAFNLLPALTVQENVTLPLRLAGRRAKPELVRAERGEPTDALAAKLTKLVADQPGVAVADRDVLTEAYAKEQEIGAWINYLMVGMIVAYTAISVVNSQVMATSARRREFGLQRLTGSTRGQVLRMMLVEAGLVSVIGIVLGTIVSTTTLVPFTLVTDGSLLPHGPIWLYLGVIGTAAALTVLSTLLTTWVTLRPRPAEALSHRRDAREAGVPRSPARGTPAAADSKAIAEAEGLPPVPPVHDEAQHRRAASPRR